VVYPVITDYLLDTRACERWAERKWSGAGRSGWAQRWADIPEVTSAGAERGAGNHGAESSCHKNSLEH